MLITSRIIKEDIYSVLKEPVEYFDTGKIVETGEKVYIVTGENAIRGTRELKFFKEKFNAEKYIKENS